MNKRSNFNISVSGSDGVAIGTNNQVTVVKKQEKHIHHHHGAKDGSEGDGKPNPEVPLGIGVLVLLALAATAYYFALYADLVYSVVIATLGTEFLAAVAAAAYFVHTRDRWPEPRRICITVVAGLATLAVYAAGEEYRSTTLTAFATDAGSMLRFWCGLNEVGRQFALLHALTTTLGFGIPAALLILPTLGLITDAVSAEHASPNPASWAPLVLAVVLVLSSAFLHTAAGWRTWTKLPIPTSPLCLK
jgi:hypothetical protein